jgi:hypothetical protein
MVTRLLEELGLFVGWRTQRNREALFFFRINEWILRQAGAAWDRPAPVRELLEHREIRQRTEAYVSRLMRSPRSASYLGLGSYLLGRRVTTLSIPWGWKDPRNTFTLPFWLGFFPEARVVHVVRHGVDVAASLHSRHLRLLRERRHAPEGRLRLWLRPVRSTFTDSVRCGRLEGGFSLWEEYIGEGRGHVTSLQGRAKEILFEDFLAHPRKDLEELARFCGLSPSEKRLAEVVARARGDRAYAYRRDQDLAAFARTVSGRLAKEGYEA